MLPEEVAGWCTSWDGGIPISTEELGCVAANENGVWKQQGPDHSIRAL
jgi:hypothetical protein